MNIISGRSQNTSPHLPHFLWKESPLNPRNEEIRPLPGPNSSHSVGMKSSSGTFYRSWLGVGLDQLEGAWERHDNVSIGTGRLGGRGWRGITWLVTWWWAPGIGKALPLKEETIEKMPLGFENNYGFRTVGFYFQGADFSRCFFGLSCAPSLSYN